METVAPATTTVEMSEARDPMSNLRNQIVHGTLHALRTKHRGILANDLPRTERNEKVLRAFCTSLEKKQTSEDAQMTSISHTTCEEEFRSLISVLKSLPTEFEASGRRTAYEFFYDLANKASSARTMEDLHASHMAAKAIMGRFSVLARLNPQKALSLVDKSNSVESISNIKDAFHDEINALKAQLEKDATSIAKQQCPDPIMFKSFELPKIVAKLLVQDDGTLNLAIKDEVMSILFGSTIESYEDEIKKSLDSFVKKQELIDIFKSVQKPPSPDMKANVLIRDSLGIAGNIPITDIDAKRAFMACMMSKARQGNIGDCYGISVLIAIKALRPELTARDIRDIFLNDCLQRVVDNQNKKFEYILNANDDSLTTPIRVQANGQVNADGTSIWQSIALKGACLSMGIKAEDAEAAIKIAFGKIAQGNHGHSSFQVTATQLIGIISKGFPEEEQEIKQDLGNVGYVAKVSNSPLRALEYIFAAMPAALGQDFVRAHVMSCVLTPLRAAFKAGFFSDSKMLNKIKNVFLSTLNNMTVFQYNPNTTEGSDSSTSGDGHSNNDGAFVMDGVENPDQFVQHVKKVINATNATLSSQLSSLKDKTLLQKTIAKITSLVEQKTFLIQAIRNFDSDNAKDPDPVGNWQSLATPWRAQYGNDPYEVERVYFERDTIETKTFTPNNATNLFIWLLEVAKEFQEKTNYLNNDTPNERLELCSPQHAFNFILENPIFATLVKDGRPSNDIVQEYIDKYCSSLEESKLGPKKHKAILDWVKKRFIPNENLEEFDSIMSKQKKPTLSECKQSIQEYLVQIHGDDAKTVKKLESMLHVGLTKKFHQTNGTNMEAVIPFADTNWNEEDNSIYFCIYPTPSGPQMGMIFQDGSNLRPMNQSEWLGGEWEVSETEVTQLA